MGFEGVGGSLGTYLGGRGGDGGGTAVHIRASPKASRATWYGVERGFFFFKLYSHFDVWTGKQPSIRVKCKYKRAWRSLALCEGRSHGGTSEHALSWMGRVEESEVALARTRWGAWLVA